MNPMHLYGSLVVPTIRDSELFAVLDVVSDTARQHDPMNYRRDVLGTVRQRGPIWHDYIACFQGAATDLVVQAVLPTHLRPIVDGGICFLRVNGLQVDYDFYGLGSWLNVEGDTVRLILMEHFNGTPEAYYVMVAERNQHIKDRIDHTRSDEYTANDLRELMGLPRSPQFNHPAAPEAVREMMTHSQWRQSTRNTVH